jgi:uncharacterized alpha-E superfamily protein
MLGRTARGLFWMFRHLERAENTTRLLEAGWRIALTRAGQGTNEWDSVLTTAGQHEAYTALHGEALAQPVINFLLRSPDNPSSVLNCVSFARTNARMVRTALSSEVWEAVNECWMAVKLALARPVTDKSLAAVLSTIRTTTAVVRGALHGTMLRNEIYNFCRLGTFVERSDNTARILDVKYYVLLPTAAFVGTAVDNTQWETILRSVSAERAYSWLNGGEVSAAGISDFLILDRRMPRSIAHCLMKVQDNLNLMQEHGAPRLPSQDRADGLAARVTGRDIAAIFDEGLHEFLEATITDIGGLAAQIERDFRFYG